MKSKEEKAKMLLTVYEEEKKRLNDDYVGKTVDLGLIGPEATPEEKLDAAIKLNRWYEDEAYKIENRFLRAILSMEG